MNENYAFFSNIEWEYIVIYVFTSSFSCLSLMYDNLTDKNMYIYDILLIASIFLLFLLRYYSYLSSFFWRECKHPSTRILADFFFFF